MARAWLDRPDHAAELRRALDDPHRLCESLGLEIGRQKQRDGVFICCPWHAEKTPSCSVTVKDGDIRVHCFGCGTSGDALSLVAAARGLDVRRNFRDVLMEAAQIAGVRLELSNTSSTARPVERRIATQPQRRAEESPALPDDRFAAIVAPLIYGGQLDVGEIVADVVRYLDGRGLLDEAKRDDWAAIPPRSLSLVRVLRDVFPEHELLASGLVRHRNGALELGWPEHRLVIPWRTPDGIIYTLQRRRLSAGEPKYVFPSSRKARHPYGIEQLRKNDAATPIAFVEGALDVLARRILDRRKGIDRVVLGVPGVENWVPEWATYAKGRVAYVATDGDSAGERVVEKWARDLYAAGAIRVIRLEPIGVKDWADVLKR